MADMVGPLGFREGQSQPEAGSPEDCPVIPQVARPYEARTTPAYITDACSKHLLLTEREAIKKADVWNTDKQCTGPKCHLSAFQIPLSEPQLTQIPRKCPCNELVSLNNRLLKKVGSPCMPKRLDILSDILDKYARLMKPKIELQDLETFLDAKKGSQKTAYHAAARSVLVSGELNTGEDLKTTDCGAEMFLKTEIYNSFVGDLKNMFEYLEQEFKKDPRMICGKNKKYSLLYQRYTTAFERALKEIPNIMKGRNVFERGQYFIIHIGGKRYKIKSDYSRFDSSQLMILLFMIEVGFAIRVLSEREFKIFFKAWLLKIRKIGKYPSGLSFHFIGTRGSGDMDTGLFNTMINAILIEYCAACSGLTLENMADGDDGLMGTDTLDFDMTTFAEFGLTIELEPVEEISEVRFCSSGFIQYNAQGDYVQMQDINKLLNNIGIVKNRQFYHCLGEYYYSLGFMYTKMYPGFPLFRQLAKFLMSIGDRKYIHKEILQRINPTFLDNLDNKPRGKIDEDIIKVEMMITFGWSATEFDRVCDWLETTTINLPKHFDRRYRPAQGKRAELLSSAEIKQVEDILEESVLSSKVPSKLASFQFLA
jgi:hypothetical protein